jgi:hypothetical protein
MVYGIISWEGEMAKKITYADRRKMIEARQIGYSDARIKELFGIKDKRTLDRAFKLGEQEHDVVVARRGILKAALEAHYNEIHTLIERWRDDLNDTQVINNPLFKCLRQHLPFSILWRDYSTWSSKYNEHMNLYAKIMEEAKQEASKWEGMRRILGAFAFPITTRIRVKLEGKPINPHEFFSPGAEYGTLTIDGYAVLEAPEPLAYTEQYQTLSDRILESEAVGNLAVLIGKLESLETKIKVFLWECLLRRDYILYACRFCPGQPKPSQRARK